MLKGKMSTFGGISDEGMMPRPGMPEGDTGLALYEPHEADKRPDLFYPADPENPNQPTWQRLRTDAGYLALRFDASKGRKYWQDAKFLVENPLSGAIRIASIVDFGPHEDTGRITDLSPGLAKSLGLKTDDECVVYQCF